MPGVTQGCANEDSAVSLMARVQIAGTDIVQADISTITWKAYDLDDTATESSSGTLTVTSVVFDTLQTDARWTKDADGYNFRHDLAASVLADGGKTYRIEHLFTPATGEQFYIDPFEITTQEIHSS